MPIDTEDGATNRFFEMLAHPPISFLIKTTYGNGPRTRSTSEFILER